MTTYDAPGCPPPRNPVTVSAVIQNTSPLSLLYHVRSYARVRIVYRNWTFNTLWDQVFHCPLAFAEDHVRYNAGFSFSVDDNLTVVNVMNFPMAVAYFGSPSACDKTDIISTRTGNPQFKVTVKSGFYDASVDAFDFVLDWVVPTALGYNYTLKNGDGSVFTSGPGPSVPVPGLEFPVEEGDFPHGGLVPNGSALWEWILEHVATASCP
jgi:hypothetical protein